jgi:hypothetical protein
VSKMLKDDIFRFLGHDLSYPILSSGPSEPFFYSASAPEMISISSLVIIAWRVRL